LVLTVEQPDGTLTFIPQHAEERAEMQDFAESWSKSRTPADFNHHLKQLKVLNFSPGTWVNIVPQNGEEAIPQPKSLISRSPDEFPVLRKQPASYMGYRFTVRPVTDPASTRKLGFRRKNPVRRFRKSEAVVKFVDEKHS
jgi:hypothetical protein